MPCIRYLSAPFLKSLESGQRIEAHPWMMQCPIRVKSMKILAIV